MFTTSEVKTKPVHSLFTRNKYLSKEFLLILQLKSFVFKGTKCPGYALFDRFSICLNSFA